MDYIREELLRQQRTLAVLMIGEGKEQHYTETKAEPVRGFALWNRREMTESMFEQGGEVVVEENLFGQGGALAAQRDMVRQVTGLSAMKYRMNKRAGRGRQNTDVIRTGGLQNAADILRYEEAVLSEGNVAGVDARSMSRTFQRDARRYDGGFSLY